MTHACVHHGACISHTYVLTLNSYLIHEFHLLQDYIVLCMDVGPSMDIAPPSGGETSLEMAIRVANQIVQQKVGLVRDVCACVCV